MIDIPRLRRELVRVDDVRAAGGDPRDLQRACRRGLVVRVRRGVYLPAGRWNDLDNHERHLVAVLAIVERCHPPFLVAGRSAAAVWGLPGAARWPEDVTLLIPTATGGKSEPGVRRTVASAAGATGAERDGIPLTTVARTALDLSRTVDFADAVAILDRALWHRSPVATTFDELWDELGRAGFSRRAGHLARAISFATDLSDSYGETLGRVAIHELGFETPLLQVELRDEDGVIKPDYLWPGDAAGEFDGRIKYTRGDLTEGDPAGVVWREKKREDRLRRLVPTVVRIVADDLRDRARLARLLEEAGVPRRERPPSGASAPGRTGAVVPEREQWPKFGHA